MTGPQTAAAGHDRLPAVLAVDGGNSKTDVALVAADGTLLASVRGPGMDAQRDGVSETIGVLAVAVQQAAAQAGLDSGHRSCGAGSPVAVHMSACLANADLPEEEEEICEALRAHGWSLTTSVVNDTFAVLRAGAPGWPADAVGAAGPASSDGPGEPASPPGDRQPGARHGTAAHGTAAHGTAAHETAAHETAAHETAAHETAAHETAAHETAAHWGVAVTCGAGINCVGLAPDGRSTRYLALGDISGDWGGGADLGLAALWWAIRAEDGRGEATALRGAVAGHFGVETVQEVTVALHKGLIPAGDLLGLAPVLLATAHDGDRVARRLVSRLAEEICVMALTAMRRLQLTMLATPVVLGGGLFASEDPLLLGGIQDRLARDAPRATIHVIDVPPVAGAALLGLDQVRAGPAAQSRLRAAYSAPVTPASAPVTPASAPVTPASAPITPASAPITPAQ